MYVYELVCNGYKIMNKSPSVKGKVVGVFALSGVVLWVFGCANGKEKVDTTSQLRAFLQSRPSPVVGIPYRVYPPDVIGFKSKYVREIDGEIRTVRPDGKVSLPLVGDVFVAGKTLQEIGYDIALAARKYYKRVDITVYMVKYNSQKIYVFGQVQQPGPMPWTGADTVLDVLARAQPTMLAWPEKIKIIRSKAPSKGGFLPEQLAGTSQVEELVVDMKAMVEKGDMSHNILLKPGDVVYVPPNPAAEIGIALRQILYPIQPVIEAGRAPVVIQDAADAVRGKNY